MTPEKHYTTSFKWEFILDKIKEEQCLLVLGPEAYTDPNGQPWQDKLRHHLQPGNNPLVQRYYEDDDFFLFDELSKQTLICHEIKSFYSQAKPGEALRKLAEIPFHVIFTVTPDKLLNRAFEEQGFPFQFGYYKKKQGTPGHQNACPPKSPAVQPLRLPGQRRIAHPHPQRPVRLLQIHLRPQEHAATAQRPTPPNPQRPLPRRALR